MPTDDRQLETAALVALVRRGRRAWHHYAEPVGARMQARFALEHGRPLFRLDSLLEHEWARQYAERPGAYVVQSADEVVERVERLVVPDVLTA